MKKLDIPILMYRNIAPILRDVFTVSPEEFRKQIDLLKKENYSIISLADLKEFLENDRDLPKMSETAIRKLPASARSKKAVSECQRPKVSDHAQKCKAFLTHAQEHDVSTGVLDNSIVLGFDGNGRDLIDIAVPILKENDFHAIFFINPDVIGKSESEFNLEDIRYLLENNFEIGLNIPELNLSQVYSAKKILQEQKEKLETLLNTKIYHLSYSADPITNELLNQIKDSGFETAVSSRDLLNSKYLTSFDLSRRQITRKINFGRFIKLLKSPALSVCLIAKNEEKFIGKCIESIKDIADEIILVDTGSDDKTKEIASAYGAKIIDCKWEDDFSKARNIYIRNATKDWIFVIDADETIEGKDGVKIRQLIEMDFDAFSFIQRTYSNEENDVNFVKSEEKEFSGYLSVPAIRLFRNFKGYCYDDVVHETIDASLMKNKAKLGNTDIAIHHYKILKGKEELKRKQLKYVEYSKKRLKENPKDVKALCDIGLGYFKFMNDSENAIPYLLKAKEIDETYIRSYIILGEIYASLKKYEEAIPLYEKLVQIEPERKADNYYYLGQLYQALNQKEKASSAFNEALRLGCAKREDILRRLQQIAP